MLKLKCLYPQKSISLLLGAGFSFHMGYPMSEQLNEKLLNCESENIDFSPAGLLYTVGENEQPKTDYSWYFRFCKDLMQYYNSKNDENFDYEKFYDYYNKEAINDSDLEKWFTSKKYNGDNAIFKDYLSGVNLIFNQLVNFYLRDENNNDSYSNNTTDLSSTFEGYTGFLKCIENFSKDYIINVHTLNHDVFFESLNQTGWINGELCDGFEDLGSPFYGTLECKNVKYSCRLAKYTGWYNKKIRLYKLHGSKDYHVFRSEKIISNYIKTDRGIDITELKKEKRNKKGQLIYETDGTQYHPDFLTGTTSKIIRYKEVLYKKLFKLFKKNLKQAEILIIIGYGCMDTEINNIVFKNFNKKKKCYLVNPDTGDAVKDFIKKRGNNTEQITCSNALETLNLLLPTPHKS